MHGCPPYNHDQARRQCRGSAVPPGLLVGRPSRIGPSSTSASPRSTPSQPSSTISTTCKLDPDRDASPAQPRLLITPSSPRLASVLVLIHRHVGASVRVPPLRASSPPGRASEAKSCTSLPSPIGGPPCYRGNNGYPRLAPSGDTDASLSSNPRMFRRCTYSSDLSRPPRPPSPALGGLSQVMPEVSCRGRRG